MKINGPYMPTKLIDSVYSPQSKSEWDELGKKMTQLNTKAINILYCVIDANEFNHVSTCNFAQEIWYGDINQVKESKINILVYKYEPFKIEPNELIIEIFTCFTNINNGLKSPDKSYSKNNLMRKELRLLSRIWAVKVMAIQEAMDLNVLSLEELLRSFMMHS